MKRIFLINIFILMSLFAQVTDELELFSQSDIELLLNRTEQLNELYNVKFSIHTSEEKDYSLINALKNKEKNVIIYIIGNKNKVLDVSLSITSDIDFSNYIEEIGNVLDNLEVLIINGEYTDYTFELMANLGDIINLIELDKKKITPEKKINLTGFFSRIFIFLIFIFSTALIYYLYMGFMNKKNLTTCANCGKNMLIDKEIEKLEHIMKIYKCPSCGKIKRINIKRY